MTPDGARRPSHEELEVLAGLPIGGVLADLPETTRSPREVLEDRLREALERAPCVVTFSGGRDSSALLAVAIHVARRDGLPEPIAVTRRHPGLEEAEETAWQELVASHLGVTEWITVDATDEFDAIGPYARWVMERFGPTWPPMAHSHLPFLRYAQGGTYVTGEGGDEILGPRRAAVLADLRRSRERVRRRHLRPLAEALAPRPVRRRLVASWVEDPRRDAWLRPDVAHEVTRTLLELTLDEPLTWRDAVRADLGNRKHTLAEPTLAAMAAEHDTVMSAPLLDPGFVAALAGPMGRSGTCCRGCALTDLVGDLLPAEVLYRGSKANFVRAMFSTHTRRFVEGWDGSHPLADLLRVDGLRAEWRKERPHAGTIPLLQRAWYADAGR